MLALIAILPAIVGMYTCIWLLNRLEKQSLQQEEFDHIEMDEQEMRRWARDMLFNSK